MAVQITTESAGRFAADIQMEVALKAGADMVSASVREICRAGQATARSFYTDCANRGIAVQHIVYDVSDCDLLAEVLGRDDLHNAALQVIFVLGRYSNMGTSTPQELAPFLKWMASQGIKPDWAVCAFGPGETSCLTAAHREGGKCRVGFENSLHLGDGRIADGNAEKVEDLIAALAQ